MHRVGETSRESLLMIHGVRLATPASRSEDAEAFSVFHVLRAIFPPMACSQIPLWIIVTNALLGISWVTVMIAA